MENKLNELLKSAIEEIKKSNDLNDIEKIRIKYLGKKGQLTLILREMGNLSKELRPIIGQKANEVRFEIEKKIDETKSKFEQQEKLEKIKIEKIDITERRKSTYLGHKHPLLMTIKELEDLFISMGFNVVTGPELESVENYIDMLY
jgi:phenylalanyl-tRNA synthetase alpha chain